MNKQIETSATELTVEDLDLVQAGLTCRKAGGDQQEYATSDTSKSIIVVC